MSPEQPPRIDYDSLHAFAVIAREQSLTRAAAALHVSQPPLSRRLRKLEETLGFVLFRRNSCGLELTEKGEAVLSLLQPLLESATKLAKELEGLAAVKDNGLRLGITTAFEQALFSQLCDLQGKALSLERKPSPALVRNIRRGSLDGAFVALPLDTGALPFRELPYSETFRVALPAAWQEANAACVRLADLNGRRLFWFRRPVNPANWDWMKAAFANCGYEPVYKEEPPEHDVLLARIAAGDGIALLPESFTKIVRPGIKYLEIGGFPVRLGLGIVWRPDLPPTLLETLLATGMHLGASQSGSG